MPVKFELSTTSDLYRSIITYGTSRAYHIARHSVKRRASMKRYLQHLRKGRPYKHHETTTWKRTFTGSDSL